MTTILEDGTVIASHLGAQDRGFATDSGSQTNVGLRVGEVKSIVFPNSPASISKTLIEYVVEVQHQDGTGPGASTTYSGCTVSNLFGGAGDMFRYTLRHDSQGQGEGGIGTGSKVLLLCVNGSTNRALIVGGVRDTYVDQTTVESQDLGHNLHFEFNGVRATVDAKGQFTLQFRGPTKADGSPDAAAGAKDSNGPSTVTISADGTIELATKDRVQYLRLDNTGKEVLIGADTGLRMTSAGEAYTYSNGAMTVETEADFLAVAVNGFRFNSSVGGMAIGVADKVLVQSAGLELGAADNTMLLGTVYRGAEALKHAQMMTLCSALGSLATTAGASLGTAATLMVVPIAGAMAAAIPMGTAAGALAGMTPVLIRLVSILGEFEAQAPHYESRYHRLD